MTGLPNWITDDTPLTMDSSRITEFVSCYLTQNFFRFEDAIVAQMVKNDGGTGDVKFHPLERHGSNIEYFQVKLDLFVCKPRYGDEDTMQSSSVVASYLQSGSSNYGPKHALN